MGQRTRETAAVIRAVLDTNVLVSALLFSGPPSQLVPAWQGGRLCPVVSAEILEEYVRVLAYSKFKLTGSEILSLIEEDVLPFVDTVRAKPISVPILRDPDDLKFLACAISAGVHWLVSGDDDLLSIGKVESVEIVSVTNFLRHLKRKS
ncbi:MAG: putative toxin-antitoxin system toxin component, PIN family [Nitrospira sp.]|nr:MAG: putative toxin-antitoxin system toxin component, PIN family [Nitrospira sp.]